MSEKESEALKVEGNGYFSSGDYISALTKYTEAICMSKTNPVLYSNRAATYIKLASWNNAIQDCNKGLELIDEHRSMGKGKALKVKLLWRKSIALRNNNEVKNALMSINKALCLEPNSLTLKEELTTIEGLLSSNEIAISKATAHQDTISKQLETDKPDVKSNIISLEIKEVDEIPQDFFNNEDEKVSSAEQILKPVDAFPKHQDVAEVEVFTKVSNTKKPKTDATQVSVFQFDEYDYPEKPSLQFLLAIKEKPNEILSSYYRYILEVPVSSYSTIFKVTGIDPVVLDLFLESCIYILQNGITSYEDKMLKLLSLFVTLPRFSLTSMFADTGKLATLKILFDKQLGKSFHAYWR